ncbi:MAG: beta-lactamase family protein [Clostridiales bacterium]|nr:beta-lactamase family protein [Clostridiales bacterium]
MNFENIWIDWEDAGDFSGVFSVSDARGVLFEKCGGFRNRSEQLLNNRDTAFGIASGTKLFTGLAVCKLIDEGKLSLNAKLCDILPHDLGQIDPRVTVFHLLTHSSGVGDYIDEEGEDSLEQLEELYRKYPVYLWDRLDYYLPMITPLAPKFQPGERFGYSNAGFVLLGLVVEAVSGLSYQQYVTDAIITPCKLKHTGYYRMDALPYNTALGYMDDGDTGEWRANIFSMPIIGGADGGIFTCAEDLDKLWRAVFRGEILGEGMLQAFLQAQIIRDDCESYGLGVYRFQREGQLAYYAVGGDFGVEFFTVYFLEQGIVASALGNSEVNAYSLLEGLLYSKREELNESKQID